jgi:proton-coupled amino acid transporter
LPFAFAQTGWMLGSVLMLFIALQGIYCMWLLAICKQLLKGRQIMTFTDVAAYALGGTGKLLVQFFLVVVQGGCCTVYLQLISTNINSALSSMDYGVDNHLMVVVVTLVLIPLSMLRFIGQLKVVSLLGNFLMLVAVLTVIIFAAQTIEVNGTEGSVAANSNVSSVALCVSSLFFAFEGMGLVLPVENSMAHKEHFPRILICAMGSLAVVFVAVGALSALAFPDIVSGAQTQLFLLTHVSTDAVGVGNLLYFH